MKRQAQVRLNHLIFACRDFITVVDPLDRKKPAWILDSKLVYPEISEHENYWGVKRRITVLSAVYIVILIQINPNSSAGTRNVLLSSFELISSSCSSMLKRRPAIINEIQPSSSRQDANTALSWAKFGCPWFKLSKPLQFQFRRLI